MQHYTRKTHTIVAWTWDEFLAYGIKNAVSMVDGEPWSFQLPGGKAVTHENRTRYIIAGVGDMTPGVVLVYYPRSKVWEIKNAEWFITEYITGLQQRTVMEECRSVDIRVTSPQCGDRYFVPVVIEMLRKMADGLEADHNRDHYREEFRPEWDNEDGRRIFTDPHRGPVIVEWSAADSDYEWAHAPAVTTTRRPIEYIPAFQQKEPDGTHSGSVIPTSQTTAEIHAGLTDAERAALAWTVAADSFFWHFTNSDGETTVSFDRDEGQTVEDAAAYCIKLLRSREIIGENDNISIQLGEIHAYGQRATR